MGHSKATGFMCEHTAEFALVPAFAKLLCDDLERVSPFFFWGSREGYSASSGTTGRLAVLFARRPKVTGLRDGTITVKLNELLFLHAAFWKRLGVPVFAGVPRVRSLEEYTLTAPISWFLLKNDGQLRDTELILDCESGRLVRGCDAAIEGPMDSSSIRSSATEAPCHMSLEQIIECIRASRKAHPGKSTDFMWFGGGYKAVYFLVRASASGSESVR